MPSLPYSMARHRVRLACAPLGDVVDGLVGVGDLVGLGDVAVDVDGSTAGLFDGLGGGQGGVGLETAGVGLLVDVADDDLRAFGGACFGDTSTESGAGTGDDDDLVL
jgi:hypothetical protein